MSMLAIYIFCLAVGGGFLALSLFGDAFDSDVDFDAGDVELDLDGGPDVGGMAKLLSLRVLVYALFGFGATGVGLTLGWSGQRPSFTLMVALTTGVASGVLISSLLSYVRKTSSGERLGEESFVGLSGRVTISVGESVGAVSVQRGSRRFTLRALLDSTDVPTQETVAVGQAVVVTRTDSGVVYVTPAPQELVDP